MMIWIRVKMKVILRQFAASFIEIVYTRKIDSNHIPTLPGHVIVGHGFSELPPKNYRTVSDSWNAAADAYVAPSLENAFGLPIMEAMA